MPTDSLRNGKTQSCGCLQRESAARKARSRATHGLARTSLYNLWRAMVARCHNPKSARYSDYGGRGITVCDRWRDVTAFVLDVEGEYKPGLTLDRRDGDQGYSPENCRWVTPKVQQRNKRTNGHVSLNGKLVTFAEFQEITGYRINRTKATPVPILVVTVDDPHAAIAAEVSV